MLALPSLTRRATTYGCTRLPRKSSTQTHKQHDALRILFCGADEFSIASLHALRELQDRRPEKIHSIDVVCRPDKRVGRGLKQIQEVPIKASANQLRLPLHQLDTFKGWSPPDPINLIIAVSFGLLVPARILTGAKYGGLNVHPSLLPDLRGPAPIQHALLKRRERTGVTLQTMHPTEFDHGVILAQTPAPRIPIPSDCTPEELLKLLTPVGAEMLCSGIEDGSFLPPFEGVVQHVPQGGRVDYAPKITPEDRHIDWKTWTADDIILRDRVLGRLWDVTTYQRCFPAEPTKRITYHGPWKVREDGADSTVAGEPGVIADDHNSATLCITTRDGRVVVPSSITVEGQTKGRGVRALLASFENRGKTIAQTV